MTRGLVLSSLALAVVVNVDAAPAAATAPAPHCHFAKAPVVLCESAPNAVAAWYLYGSNMRAAADSNNRELMRQAGCTVVLERAETHKVLENSSGRVASRWGWTRVALVTLDGRDLFHVAGNYLRGTCEMFSTHGARRDQGPLRPADPTPPRPAAEPGAPKFEQSLIGKIGVAGSTFP